MTTVTLTDDEVVALALQMGAAWPTPLLTVDPTPESLSAAGRRGVRSLVARDLMIVKESSVIADTAVEQITQAAAACSRWVGSYVADEIVVAGASTFNFESGDTAVLDLVSPAGIHSLTETEAQDSRRVLEALAKNVFDFGVKGTAPRACLVMAASDSQEWLRISLGRVERGTMNESFTEFSVDETHTEWPTELVAAIVAGP